MNELFQERLKNATIDFVRYGKYIFNGHLMIVLLFLGSGVAFYYSEWIKTLSNDLPYHLVGSIILGSIIAFGKVITLLKGADLVYVTPLEHKMKPYFQKCVTLSYALQIIIPIFIALVLLPLFAKGGFTSRNGIILFFVVVLLLKYVNLQLRLYDLYGKGVTGKGIFENIGRIILNSVTIFFLLEESYVFVVVMVVLWGAALFYFRKRATNEPFQWSTAVSLDEHRWALFYSFASLFVDVPQVEKKVHKRNYLSLFYDRKTTNAYQYKLERAFVRHENYGSLMLRLWILGALASMFISFRFTLPVVACIVIYLTMYSTLPLGKHFDLKLWTSVYPSMHGTKEEALQRVILKVMLWTGCFFTVLAPFFTWNFTDALLSVGIIFVFIGLVYNGYVRRAIRKMEFR